jgi:hypothetical protein
MTDCLLHPRTLSWFLSALWSGSGSGESLRELPELFASVRDQHHYRRLVNYYNSPLEELYIGRYDEGHYTDENMAISLPLALIENWQIQYVEYPLKVEWNLRVRDCTIF